MDFPHKEPVMQKVFPYHDIILYGINEVLSHHPLSACPQVNVLHCGLIIRPLSGTLSYGPFIKVVNSRPCLPYWFYHYSGYKPAFLQDKNNFPLGSCLVLDNLTYRHITHELHDIRNIYYLNVFFTNYGMKMNALHCYSVLYKKSLSSTILCHSHILIF